MTEGPLAGASSPGRSQDGSELSVGRTALPGAQGGAAVNSKRQGSGFPRGVFRIPELATGPVQLGGLPALAVGVRSFGGLDGDQLDGFGG